MDLFCDDSNRVDLDSERQIVKDILVVEIAKGAYAIRPCCDQTTIEYHPVISTQTLILNNLLDREKEPEDAVLVASGLLPRLTAQARKEPASLDWERDLEGL
jgi:hypothetical protein